MMPETLEESTGRIKQLDDSTIGRIAAGEVVERPAQVVKELIENSIDAGSKRIEVRIERGGFELISIEDDGSGIMAEDLPLAVRRHATSKLSVAEDLSSIETLGFRGEALASIGSVSNLTVESRPEGAEGYRIVVDGGEVGDVAPAGIAQGTRIEVSSIFANVPARLAFQRRPSTETAATVDVVAAHALVHPSIGFHLVVDGRRVLAAPAVDDAAERLFDVLGAASDRLIALGSPPEDADAPGQEKWSGWISSPAVSRGRPDDIHVFVNGRAVAATPFLQAIRRGYKSRLMIGRHPVCVLFLDLPSDEVDVNIHPTKREVRIRHSWRVLERLERSIAHSLHDVPTGAPATDEMPLGTVHQIAKPLPDSELERSSYNHRTAREERDTDSTPGWVAAADTATEAIQTRFLQQDSPSDSSATRSRTRPLSTSTASQMTLPGLPQSPIAPPLSSEERDLHRHASGSSATSPLQEPEKEVMVTDVPEMEPLAQFADTYILAQGGDVLYVVDQHALHERIRYERLRHEMSSWEPLNLIAPLEVDLSAQAESIAMDEGGRLRELGFVMEADDSIPRRHRVLSVPSLLAGDERLLGFLEDLLAEMANSESKTLDSVERLQDEIAFMRSCRGAVKANQRLTMAEMRRLLNDMRTIENPWACVHGRPTILELDAHRLDEHFGRLG